MKTDLQKILSISGEQGLFRYVSQAKNGMIAESFITNKKSVFGPSAKVSSLSDISIFTNEGEVSLKEVLEKMHGNLGDNPAPAAKSDPKVIQTFFAEVLPDYDDSRFYVSHMKKVLTWYNLLKEYASLDFEDEGNGEAEGADAGNQAGE